MENETLRAWVSRLHDPLPEGVDLLREAIATNRAVDSLLWLGYETLTFFRPTFVRDDDFLRCVQAGILEAARSVAVLCLAYRLDLTQVPVRAKRAQALVLAREERLKQLQEELFEHCWSLAHAFSSDQLRDSRSVRLHEIGIQIGCCWHTLMELATWCGVALPALLCTSSPDDPSAEGSVLF